jgi:hypothetical protein
MFDDQDYHYLIWTVCRTEAWSQTAWQSRVYMNPHIPTMLRNNVAAMRTAERGSVAGVQQLPTDIRWAPNRVGRVHIARAPNRHIDGAPLQDLYVHDVSLHASLGSGRMRLALFYHHMIDSRPPHTACMRASLHSQHV